MKQTKLFFLASNFLPLLGIFFLGWDLTHLLFLYWAESAVIGLYHVLRIIRSSIPETLKAFLTPFFIIHFGGFMTGHAIFLFVITFILSEQGLLDPSLEQANLLTTHVLLDPFSAPAIILAMVWPFLIAYFISHGFDFYQDAKEEQSADKEVVMGLLFSPYRRIFVMHLTIIFGIFAFVGLGMLFPFDGLASTAIIPLVFLLIKTYVEFKQTFKPKKPKKKG